MTTNSGLYDIVTAICYVTNQKDIPTVALCQRPCNSAFGFSQKIQINTGSRFSLKFIAFGQGCKQNTQEATGFIRGFASPHRTARGAYQKRNVL